MAQVKVANTLYDIRDDRFGDNKVAEIKTFLNRDGIGYSMRWPNVARPLERDLIISGGTTIEQSGNTEGGGNSTLYLPTSVRLYQDFSIEPPDDFVNGHFYAIIHKNDMIYGIVDSVGNNASVEGFAVSETGLYRCTYRDAQLTAVRIADTSDILDAQVENQVLIIE